MISVFGGGEIVLLLILVCGIFATIIIVERARFFISAKKKEASLFPTLNTMVQRRDFDHAMLSCEEAGTPVALLMRKILQFRNYPDTDIKEMMENETHRLVPILEKRVAFLGTLAHAVTLLGLLGTIIGFIQIFGFFGSNDAMLLNQSKVAAAIAEALITTAAGLFVAIPTIVFHNYFVACIDSNLTRMETAASDLMIRLSGRDRLL